MSGFSRAGRSGGLTEKIIDDLAEDYGVQANEMWINSDALPSPGPFGILKEGGQFSQLKKWACE